MGNGISLEIACNNVVSALHAWKGGADRIELIENLADGGCTPSYGMIKQVKKIVPIPVFVMIRPRGGNFLYTEHEIEVMLNDIEICHQLDVDGIVFGILDKNGAVDQVQCVRLLKQWKHKPATFHRAIDRSKHIFDAARQIIDLGFERILTSGGNTNVEMGKDTIKQLQENFGTQIEIMPGAGVTPQNAMSLLLYTNCKSIHATAKKTTRPSGGNFNPAFDDSLIISDLDEIQLLASQLKTVQAKA